MKQNFRILLFLILLGFTQPPSEDAFDVAMGSKTKHWAHIEKQVDLEDLSTYRALFHRNIPLVQSAKGDVKIPKTVHFIWLGPRPFPPQSVSNVRSWIAQNPDWTFKFWTDRPREAPCRGMETILIKEYPFPYLGRCYAASDNWGEKSDVLRFEILFNEGGVYVDHDASCLTPFEPYHQAYTFYAGLETPHPDFVGRNITAGNGVIGSAPGHPIIQKVIELIDQRWDALAEKYSDNDHFSKTQIVMERTYMALTDALKTTLDPASKTDIVFPASYFFPKKGLKPVLSEHFFANSWAAPAATDTFEKETRQSITKIEKRYDHMNHIQFAALGVNLLLIGFGLFFLRKKRTS
jgi:LPXTG-motif cell wall-anchored protein